MPFQLRHFYGVFQFLNFFVSVFLPFCTKMGDIYSVQTLCFPGKVMKKSRSNNHYVYISHLKLFLCQFYRPICRIYRSAIEF